MISGNSILAVHPQCSVQCPTPGRWNRMHYSCLQGAGFEVSVCIMKAERIGIVMLYGSLVLSLPFCLFFFYSPSCTLFSFLSLCPTLSFSIFFYSVFFFFVLLPSFITRPHRHAPSHKHLLVLFSWFIMSMFPFVGVVIDWNRSC